MLSRASRVRAQSQKAAAKKQTSLEYLQKAAAAMGKGDKEEEGLAETLSKAEELVGDLPEGITPEMVKKAEARVRKVKEKQARKQAKAEAAKGAGFRLPKSPVEALQMMSRQSPYVLGCGFVATAVAVYIGGMVARLW